MTYSNEQLSTWRNEKEYCPECGQHMALHTYAAASATEPPEMDCPDGEDTYDDYRQDEPTYNEVGELGYWAIKPWETIEF